MVLTSETVPYLLLNPRTGWQQAALEGVLVDDEARVLRLQLRPDMQRPVTDVHGTFGGVVLPALLAQDSQENIYLLNTQTCLIKRFDTLSQRFRVLPTLGGRGREPRQFFQPQALAISAYDDLYVVDTGNRRVQVFALKGHVLRYLWGPLVVTRDAHGRIMTHTEQFTDGESDSEDERDEASASLWEPRGIAIGPDGCAYVTDYVHSLVHVFDPWGDWQRAFNGATGTEPPVEKPTAITIDTHGFLYILQEGKSSVSVFDTQGHFQQRIMQAESVQGRFSPRSVAVDENGTIYVCDGATRNLCSSCRNVDGSYASPTLCRSLYCEGNALIFDKTGEPLHLDEQARCVQHTPSLLLYRNEGHSLSLALDSQHYRCQWHRIQLTATVPPGTSITVATFTSETDRPLTEIQRMADEQWDSDAGQTCSTGSGGEWDCLIKSQPGRYMWLRLLLQSDGIATPTIEQVRVYFPRTSSLRYLPATFGEDPISADLLDRFLSLFDTLRDDIGQRITDISRYFDPMTTPVDLSTQHDFLSWLASWIGLVLNRHWPEAKQRAVVQQAAHLYTLRGTVEGLRAYIQLYTDTRPAILEHFKLRSWLFLNEGRLGAHNALWGKEIVNRLQPGENAQIGSFQLIDSGDPVRDPFYQYANQFTVFVPARQPLDDADQQALRSIIEIAKPAHTQGNLRVVLPQLRIGVQSLLGVDTLIGCYPTQTVIGESIIGQGNVLAPSLQDVPPSMQPGTQSRIGSSTQLD